ncbi:MAG: V-type ATP synthase subunit F [Verrucomicrobiales bacterium]|nr:V-type ATP synthase subunit F [Verrucomicrobiales bacterium]
MDIDGFFCIGDEDTVRGFRSVGVPGVVAISASTAACALAAACTQPGVQILILTESIGDLLPEQVAAVRLHPGGPLIAEIPGPDATAHAASRLRHQVQAATGLPLDWKEEVHESNRSLG